MLPLNSVISPMRNMAWNTKMKAAVNNFASNIVLHTLCNVGIYVFSSSDVIGNREFLLGN